MKAFKLDAKGDLVRENGSFVRIEGDEELAQQVRMSIQTEKGEWFLDKDEGMDREPIFSKIFNETEAKDSIIEAIANVSEPLLVETITFVKNPLTRMLEVNMVLRKENGETLNMEGVEI